jgi:2-oxoglutarate dehydrogenase E2 component (dihydrolipoamide succinyltransferase)
MATNVAIPAMGESITEAVLVRWLKTDGDTVRADEPICELETDKANLDLPSPASGVLHTLKPAGESVRVGETIGRIDESGDTARDKTTSNQQATATIPPIDLKHSDRDREKTKPQEERSRPAAPSNIQASIDTGTDSCEANHEAAHELTELGEKGSSTPPDLQEKHAAPGAKQNGGGAREVAAEASKKVTPAAPSFGSEGVRRVPMSKIRKRIAERLIAVNRDTAMLTTFNEIDMKAVLELRNRYKARFEEMHGVSLGFMSFFAAASATALRQFPVLNAQIDGNDIVYHEHVNLGVAVSTERGLVVPVLHNVDTMSFGRIEVEIKRVATAAREGKLSLPDLSGGTFTITNGGTFGSLLSTPILNPPQSGILGMHAIQKRPVVVNDRIDIRPMMYVSLTYDHRLVDGSDSVRFLVRVKELVEDPSRLLLGI